MSCAVSPFPPSSPAPFERAAHLRIVEQDMALLHIHFPCAFSAVTSPRYRSSPSQPVGFTRSTTVSDFAQSSPSLTRPLSRFRAEPKNASRKDDNLQDEPEPTNRSMAPTAGPTAVVRKRPSRLAIPDSARLASLAKANQFVLPCQEAETQSSEASLHGVSCKKGRKNSMEDTHTALTNLQGDFKQAFFGVFDGHGGKGTADFVAENLGRHVSMAIDNCGDCKASLEDAMRNAYMATDAELFDKHVSGGACSVSAFMKNGRMVVANAGDCKAVLSRGGKAECLSTLHRASKEAERARVEDLGGLVDCFNGTWRVQGTLAVTRAFGDSNLKQWVSVEPAVKILDITKDCEFLILASDGLWDQMSDQEAVDCVRKVLVLNEDTQALHSTTTRANVQVKRDACNELILKACDRGNRDDITVMIVLLQPFCLL